MVDLAGNIYPGGIDFDNYIIRIIMKYFNRRSFLSISGSVIPGIALANKIKPGKTVGPPEYPRINFNGDGYLYSPKEYAKELAEIVEKENIVADTYGMGGVVEQLEAEFAKRTGKEKAIYLPSGTMANSLALRILANEKPAVIVPEKSHTYHDEADAATALHNKKLVPLGKNLPYFSPEILFETIEQQKKARFGNDIGAIEIEIATRRVDQRVQPLDQLQKIWKYSRENNIPVHMDGARLYMAAGYSGVSVEEYSKNFDTVYISLYKYLRASAGAILCGPTKIIDQVPRLNKICGGNMFRNWPNAAVALYYLRDFEKRFAASIQSSEKLFSAINKLGGINIKGFEDGSNIFRMTFTNGDGRPFLKNLRNRYNIAIARSESSSPVASVQIKINESILLTPVDELIGQFTDAWKKI